jgi:hypothetical protein
MSVKQTYALPQAVWQPTADGQAFQFTNHSIEITALKLTSGGGAAHVSFYDNGNGTKQNLRWVLDSSTAYDDCQVFPNPLFFKNGVYAVIDQGGNTNSEICLAGIPLYT